MDSDSDTESFTSTDMIPLFSTTSANDLWTSTQRETDVTSIVRGLAFVYTIATIWIATMLSLALVKTSRRPPLDGQNENAERSSSSSITLFLLHFMVGVSFGGLILGISLIYFAILRIMYCYVDFWHYNYISLLDASSLAKETAACLVVSLLNIIIPAITTYFLKAQEHDDGRKLLFLAILRTCRIFGGIEFGFYVVLCILQRASSERCQESKSRGVQLSPADPSIQSANEDGYTEV
jgi:hypothetical protein